MPLRPFADSFFALLEFEECNDSARHELRSNSPARKLRKLRFAEGNILLDLNDTDLVASTFSLHRKYVMCPFLVNPHIQLIRFHLSDAWHSRA